MGDVSTPVKSQPQLDAEALLAIVNQRVTDSRFGGLPIPPGRREQITREEAMKLGLPFTSYADLVKAAKGTAPVTPKQRQEGTTPTTPRGAGSLADRLRRRALGTGAGTPPPTGQ